MEVKQVYQLMNLASKQMWGDEYIAVEDLSGFVSFGDAVLSDSKNLDNYLGVISPEIAKTVVRTLDDFDVDFKNLMVDGFTYGTFVRKLTVRILSAQETNAWNVGDNGFTPTNFKIDKPSISEKLFSGIKTFEFDLTIPDNIMRGSFRNPESMGALISAMVDALVKSAILYVSTANRLAVNTAIARVLNEDKRVIHLLTEMGYTGTADKAQYDPEVLRYSNARIAQFIKFMSKPSVLFNEENELRVTARDNMHVFFNSIYGENSKRFLESGTYWKDLVSMPYFEEVVAWQGLLTEAGQGETQLTLPDFKSATTINGKIKIDDDTEVTINQSYIIGAIFDRQHVFTTLYDQRMSTDRNNRNEYTNYTNIIDIGHGVDPSENSVVFVLD